MTIQAWGLFTQSVQRQGTDLTTIYLEFTRLSDSRLYQATLRVIDLEIT